MKHSTAVCSVIAVAAAAAALLQAAHAGASPTASSVPSLIVAPVNANDTVTLAGNTFPLAVSATDQGLVPDGQQLGPLFIVLRRSAAQERALAAFGERQLDATSPDYHHWLQPQEFGLQYGPNDADISAVRSWLQAAGLQIRHVSQGRIAIEFSGTAAQVREAFGVEMHRYLVKGESVIANDRDPQIPRALTPVVAGVSGLNTYSAKAAAPASPPAASTAGLGATPELSYQDDSYSYAFMTPRDFATIYNSLPLWNASKPVVGSGVTIAVIGDNDVKSDDITTYQSTFGLQVRAPTIELVGSDPGGSSETSTVALEMASAAAPGASLELVVPAGGATLPSVLTAVQYAMDKNNAAVVVFPYFACERILGSSNNALINGYWQQGEMQGMSIVVATGDFGSAGCNNSGGADSTGGSQGGLEVNGFASSPFVTAVGGTDFAWQWGTNSFSTYWNAPGTPIQYESAKGYIPEAPWNVTCTNALLLQGQDYLIEDVDNGKLPDYTTNQNLCSANYNNSYYKPLLDSIASGGGQSNCTALDSSGNCKAGSFYSKPSWQKGTGVPSDGKRDLPDVSLFASGGWLDVQQFGVEFDPPTPIIPSTEILVCYSGGSPSHACAYGSYADVAHQTYGGTGAAASYWAGILALVVQKQGGERQGLVNPTLYSLFSGENLTNCNTSKVAAGNTCVFYDISAPVTNGVACVPGSSKDCYVIPGSTGEYETTYGILDGYTAGVGYDQTTGLGSVNITNLVNKWPSSSGPAVTLSAASLAFGNQAPGSSSASKSVTLTNSGTASLTLSSIVLGGETDDFVLSKTCGTSLAAGASCTLSVVFKPVSAGSKTGTVTITDTASSSTPPITLTGTGT
jgi:subtilase family serine protease